MKAERITTPECIGKENKNETPRRPVACCVCMAMDHPPALGAVLRNEETMKSIPVTIITIVLENGEVLKTYVMPKGATGATITISTDAIKKAMKPAAKRRK